MRGIEPPLVIIDEWSRINNTLYNETLLNEENQMKDIAKIVAIHVAAVVAADVVAQTVVRVATKKFIKL